MTKVNLLVYTELPFFPLVEELIASWNVRNTGFTLGSRPSALDLRHPYFVLWSMPDY